MLGIDFFNRQRYVDALTKRYTVRRKVIRSSLKAVVNMNGVDLAWPFLSACQQQSGGIGSTTVADGER
jgi:DNA-binding IclR family transcriptional regulator